MNVVAAVVLVVGVVAAAIGWLTFDEGGRNLRWVGGATVAASASMLFPDVPNGVRYALWTAAAMLMLVSLVRGKREAWHRLRVELLLVGATIIGIMALTFLTDLSSEMQRAGLALVGMMALTLVGIMVIRGYETLRIASRKR